MLRRLFKSVYGQQSLFFWNMVTFFPKWNIREMFCLWAEISMGHRGIFFEVWSKEKEKKTKTIWLTAQPKTVFKVLSRLRQRPRFDPTRFQPDFNYLFRYRRRTLVIHLWHGEAKEFLIYFLIFLLFSADPQRDPQMIWLWFILKLRKTATLLSFSSPFFKASL